MSDLIKNTQILHIESLDKFRTQKTVTTSSTAVTNDTLPVNQSQSAPTMPIDSPGEMYTPFNLMGSGNDVYSRTYLWLKTLQADPQNTNNPEFFLLYLSNITSTAASGQYDKAEFDEFAQELTDIGWNIPLPGGNEIFVNIVAASVAITMAQIYITNGFDSDAAHDFIYELFPESQTDAISVSARKSADYLALHENSAKNPFDTTQPATEKTTQANQQIIEDNWYRYITNGNTNASINGGKDDIRVDMILGSGDNIYAALIALLLLFEAAGYINLEAYGTLSNELAHETDDLNELMYEWGTEDYFDPSNPDASQNAIDFMTTMQELQEEMNETFADSSELDGINQKFEAIYDLPAMSVSSYGYIDDEGRPVAGKRVYINQTSADSNITIKEPPTYLGSTDVTNMHTVFNGQAVDSQGRPLYELDGVSHDEGATVYLGEDGYFYYENTTDRVSYKDGDDPFVSPLYWTDDPTATDNLTTGTGTETDENHRKNPELTEPLSENPVGLDTHIYVNSEGEVIHVSPDGQAPLGATIQEDANNNYYYQDNEWGLVYLEPLPGYSEVTLGDQAKYAYQNDSALAGDGLAETLNYYQGQTPLNPNLSSAGGIDTGGPRDGEEAFLNLFDGLSTALSQQSATVGTEVSEQTSQIEVYINSFSSYMLDDSTGMLAAERRINDRWKA